MRYPKLILDVQHRISGLLNADGNLYLKLTDEGYEDLCHNSAYRNMTKESVEKKLLLPQWQGIKDVSIVFTHSKNSKFLSLIITALTNEGGVKVHALQIDRENGREYTISLTELTGLKNMEVLNLFSYEPSQI